MDTPESPRPKSNEESWNELAADKIWVRTNYQKFAVFCDGKLHNVYQTFEQAQSALKNKERLIRWVGHDNPIEL